MLITKSDLNYYIFFLLETCICQRWPMAVMAFTFFIFGAIGIIVSYALLQDKALEHQHHVIYFAFYA